MFRPGAISLLLLTGCAIAPVGEKAPADNPFALPAGSPRSPHAGYIGPATPDSEYFTLALAPNHGVRVGYQIVTRDEALRPTALLVVERLQGRVALARLLRGRPTDKAEAVLPSSELTRQAQSLPAFRPGS